MSESNTFVPGVIPDEEQSNLSVSELKCSEDPEVIMEKLEESEMIPGLFDFIKKHEIEVDKIYRSFKSFTELDNGDVKLINDLVSKIGRFNLLKKKLHNMLVAVY
uniref:Phosphoprotein n=1 Tax=Strongyloides stercoralis TaxID=6248 RepID=A0A0K0EDQ6_STRER